MDLPLDRLNYLADITRESSANISIFEIILIIISILLAIFNYRSKRQSGKLIKSIKSLKREIENKKNYLYNYECH
jgi:hypothetical protein